MSNILNNALVMIHLNFLEREDSWVMDAAVHVLVIFLMLMWGKVEKKGATMKCVLRKKPLYLPLKTKLNTLSLLAFA